MIIDVLEYFQGEARRHAEKLAAAQVSASEARTKLPSLEAERAAAKKSLEDKRELKTRAEQEGLDTTKLNGGISELQTQFDSASARLASCKVDIDAARPGVGRPFERQIELARSMRDCFYSHDAVEISELRDCYPHLIAKVSKHDASGRPAEVEVWVGAMQRVTIRVVNAQARVSAEFKPASLGWLTLKPEKRDAAVSLSLSDLAMRRRRRMLEPEEPEEPEEPDAAVSKVNAFLDTRRSVLVLATTRPDPRDVRQRLRNVDVAESLEDHVREQLAELEEIDLEQPYPEKELVEVIRTKVLALTAASGPFRPSSANQTSAEIQASIKEDWAAFVACPWAGDVKGTLALLKYHAENGEKPRFWSEEYEGHFGFRLRTRDHTWIVGELFIVPGEPPPSARERMMVGHDGAVASLGRLHLKAGETR